MIKRLLLIIVILVSLLPIIGFFLHWGVKYSYHTNFLHEQAIIRTNLVGENAGYAGYTILLLGIVSFISAFLTIIKFPPFGAYIKFGIASSVLGIFVLIMIRISDYFLKIFELTGWEFKNCDLILGFPVGPGLALIGFSLYIILNILYINISTK